MHRSLPGGGHLNNKKIIIDCYSPYTILWKLPFCISPCSEAPPAKCDLIILLHPKSLEKCHKNFENWLTNLYKNLTAKWFPKDGVRRVVLPSFKFLFTHKWEEAPWPSGRASDSRARGQGFDPHSGRHVVSLSKIHLPPKKYW